MNTSNGQHETNGESGMKVELYRDWHGDKPNDRVVGTIGFKNGQISGDTEVAQRILNEPVRDIKDNRRVYSSEDPVRFMEVLPYKYRSYEFRAKLIRSAQTHYYYALNRKAAERVFDLTWNKFLGKFGWNKRRSQTSPGT